MAESQDTDVINFYELGSEYGLFSNFSHHPILLHDKTWPTTEHYFQAQKFAGTSHEEEVRLAAKPGDAALMGRDRSRPLRKDWEQVKDSLMKECLIAKFTQHKDAKDFLLSTGNKKIVEHTKNDTYWGDGGDGSGKNMLGKLLVEVREELRKS